MIFVFIAFIIFSEFFGTNKHIDQKSGPMLGPITYKDANHMGSD